MARCLMINALMTLVIIKDYFFWYSSVHQKRSEAEPSCVSMKSGQSTDNLIDFKSGDTQTAIR